MKLDFNLQVTQKQGIALTAQVQQAIKLLHMTNMEIQEYVDDKFQDIPFIETTGEFEEQKQSEITKNNRADIDKSLDDNPYKQSKNEINTKNQSRKLNGNPNHFAIGGSSSGGKYAAVKA